MANILTTGEAYDPYFYANEALAQLNKALGLAYYVYRGYDRTATDKGSTIKIRRPGVFAAQSMPISLANATDIAPDYMDMIVDQWYGTMFGLTDKELTYSREQIISEHVGPLAIGVADKIDQTLVALQKIIPWYLVGNTTDPVEDFPDIRQLMFDRKVPTGNRRYMIGGGLQNAYEKESIFYQANTGVDAAMLQRDGFLGRKFGFDIFANQNVTSHTSGTLADLAGAVLAGGFAAKAEVMSIDDLTDAETVVAGDTFVIAGNTQRYAIIAGTLTVAANTIAPTFTPGLAEAATADAVVTLRATDASEVGCAFHRDAFALGMAPLSSLGDGAGARIATVTDPITGITLRSTIFYDPATAKNYVRIDALWGVKTLNPNLAVNVEIA